MRLSGWVSWRNWSPDWQGRNEVRWRPGQDASLAPPFSNLRSSGNQCTVLKNVRVTLLGFLAPSQSFGAPTVFQRPQSDLAPGNCAPLASSLRPCWLNHNATCKKLHMLTLANNLPLCDKMHWTCLISSKIMAYVTMQLCNSSLHIHGQRRGVLNYCLECNEVRWRPGQDASLAPPCSNLRSFGSKCTALKYLWHC